MCVCTYNAYIRNILAHIHIHHTQTYYDTYIQINTLLAWESSLCNAFILCSVLICGWSAVMMSSVIPFGFCEHRFKIRSSNSTG